MGRLRGKVVGRLVVEGCRVTARALGPRVFELHVSNAILLNGSEVPEGRRRHREVSMKGGALLFTSRRDVMRMMLDF